MGFSPKVKEQALIASGRCCCLCHKYCSTNIEVHHIKPQAKGGSDDFDNAIPLCFDCHADVGNYNSEHPKGTKFTENELKQHRDNWYKKVKNTGFLIENEDYLELDRKTYYALEKYLEREKFRYLSTMVFGAQTYPIGYLNDFDYFLTIVTDPKYEYLDADIESKKADLAGSIASFFRKALAVMHSDDGKNVGVPRDWELDLPDKYIEAIETLENESDEMYKAYSDYIKLCRRKLKVDVK